MTFLNDNDENPRDIIVYGRAYTPDYNLNTPVVNVFKSNQIDYRLADATNGKPVFIEHDTKYPVGKVLKSEVDPLRNLNAFLEVSGNKLVNSKLPPCLEIDPFTNKRFYSGLSMGTDVELNIGKTYTTVKSVRPTEVSIVKNPDRPNAYIYDYWLVPRDYKGSEYLTDYVLGSDKLKRHHLYTLD
jgi:hypothetical protein